MKQNNHRTLIIAEAGVNHNGSIEIAKNMIHAAHEAGADIVKFQTFKAEKLATAAANQADYQSKNDKKSNQLEMLKALELSYSDFLILKKEADRIGIEFLSTAFDLESLIFLQSMNPMRWKIPSGEITNYPYLDFLAKVKEPIILSTGMSTQIEIDQALKVLTSYGKNLEDITILHCTSDYPCDFSDVNLKAMQELANKCGTAVGYSDHTLGIEIAIAAVAMGAVTIEKHFTFDKNSIGPDHKASLSTEELKQMISCIRNLESAFGTSRKILSVNEEKTKLVARKSIVAARDISHGEILTPDNITTKRPGTGLSPMEWPKIIGKMANRSFKKNEMIE